MNLDDAYANGAYIEGAENFPPIWADSAARFRATYSGDLELPYGPGARQRYDLFRPEGRAKGLFVFVHGGYWLKFDKNSWSHLANGAIARGWAVAIPSYDLCPTVRISEISRQVATAIEAAAAQVDGPIALAGHSAGGHLVARMVTGEVLTPKVLARVSRVVPISPVADLRPLLQTSMNAELGLDQAESEAESPALMPQVGSAEVTVWVGADERPAFLDQAAWLSQAWGCDRMIAGGQHHFDVIAPLEDPASNLTRVALGA